MSNKISGIRVYVCGSGQDVNSWVTRASSFLSTRGITTALRPQLVPDYEKAVRSITEAISNCDAAIVFIGRSYGSEPSRQSLPLGAPRQSYAMMEADVALALKRDVYFLVISDSLLPLSSGSETKDSDHLQSEYRTQLLRDNDASGATLVESNEELLDVLQSLDLKPRRRRQKGPISASADLLIASVLCAAVAGLLFGLHLMNMRSSGGTTKPFSSIFTARPRKPDLSALSIQLQAVINESTANPMANTRERVEWNKVVVAWISSVYGDDESRPSSEFRMAIHQLQYRGCKAAVAYLESTEAAVYTQIMKYSSEQSNPVALNADLQTRTLHAFLCMVLQRNDHAKKLLDTVAHLAPDWEQVKLARARLR